MDSSAYRWGLRTGRTWSTTCLKRWSAHRRDSTTIPQVIDVLPFPRLTRWPGSGSFMAVNPERRRAWPSLAAILAAATLLTLIAVNLMTLAGINSSRPLILHMRAVQALLLQTRAALVDAETGRRGFLLLGERVYLEPLERAEKSLPVILAELRGLHLDEPSRQRRIEE